MENLALNTDRLGSSICFGSSFWRGALAVRLMQMGWLVGTIGVFLTTNAASAAYQFPSEGDARESVGGIVEALVKDQFAPDPCEILIVPDARGGTILEPEAINKIVENTMDAVQANAFGKDCLVTSTLSSQLDPAINDTEALVARFREEGRRGLVMLLEYYKLSEGVVMMGQLKDIQQGLFISGSGRHQLPQANLPAEAEPELSPVSLSTSDAKIQPAEDNGLSIDRSVEVRTFTVYFELGQTSLDDAGQQIAREAAIYAKDFNQIEIYVEGHTDSSGSPEVNYRVATERAQAVRDALVSEASNLSELIRTVEFGEDRPVIATGPNVRESKNRRVEITVAPISNTLRIGGTGLALGGLQILANAFMAENPDVDIEIPPSLGSGGGIKALLADAIDLSVSTRPPKEKEEAKGVTAFRYGRTPFVFATSEENDVDGVTTEQLADFYSGRVTKWPNGRDLQLVLRPPGR